MQEVILIIHQNLKQLVMMFLRQKKICHLYSKHQGSKIQGILCIYLIVLVGFAYNIYQIFIDKINRILNMCALNV